MFGYARILRIADGPDEVHNQVVARRELKRAAQLKTAAIPA
jgi:alkylation response protein AidB-like acyl-CoA dehydrogenase